MADKIEISSPIVFDSKERIAYDLAVTIDSQANAEVEKDKTYWLTLYSQCLKATKGWAMKDILKEDLR